MLAADLSRGQKRKASDSAGMASDTQSSSHKAGQGVIATGPAVSLNQSDIQTAFKEEKSEPGRTSSNAVDAMPQQTPDTPLSESQHIIGEFCSADLDVLLSSCNLDALP